MSYCIAVAFFKFCAFLADFKYNTLINCNFCVVLSKILQLWSKGVTVRPTITRKSERAAWFMFTSGHSGH